jgi:secondary thiamine-phosphate synthase enzyme
VRQAQREFVIDTHGQGLYEFTREVERWLREERLEQGLLSLFCRHSSASLLIQENADPDVVHDLQAFFSRMVPEGASLYRHSSEGPDDMPAHIRAALTPTSLTIPLAQCRAALGAWQGIYLFEHRDRPHRRHVLGHLLGE